MLSQGYNATDRQLGWLLQRMDRAGKGEIDPKDIKVGLKPVKILP
jgi:hypothetical protein